LLKENGDVFTTRISDHWVVFYEKASFYDFLPNILSDDHVTSLGREMAEFHNASAEIAPLLSKSWKSLGSDVATLYDFLGNENWRNEHHLSDAAEHTLRNQCDRFLTNAEKLGYHQFKRLPVLIDWNLGNFSVGFDGDGFKLFSRWDYDWFRIEPRTMDFYFCARVVRPEGDQDTFSYTVAPFFEQRFAAFLRTYHQASPLADEEILFMKEAYRVFLLNYVIRIGEHFFRPEICKRLHQEALNLYFPQLEQADFSQLLRVVK
jgi:Ser/Thr protein kinase RdoA (MazF antagonist)